MPMPQIVLPLADVLSSLADTCLASHDVDHASVAAALAVLEEALVDAAVEEVDAAVPEQPPLPEVAVQSRLVRVLRILITTALVVYVSASGELILDEVSLAGLSVALHYEEALAVLLVLVPVSLVDVPVRVVVETSPLLLALVHHPRIDITIWVLDLSPCHVFDGASFFGEGAHDNLALVVLIHADARRSIDAPLPIRPRALIDCAVLVEAYARAVPEALEPAATVEVAIRGQFTAEALLVSLGVRATILDVALDMELLPALLFKRQENFGLVASHIECGNVLEVGLCLLVRERFVVTFQRLIELRPFVVLKLHVFSVQSEYVLHGSRADTSSHLETLVFEGLGLGVPHQNRILIYIVLILM
jgi:hypothetical protein